MSKPSPLMLVLGHPVVAGAAILGGGIGLIGFWSSTPNHFLLGLIGFGGACLIGEASQQRLRYDRWKREWEALNGPTPKKNTLQTIVVCIVTLAIFGTAFGLATPGEADSAVFVRIATGYGVVLTIVIAWRFLRTRSRARPRRTGKVLPVAITAKPLLSVPSLPSAYQALPEHCYKVLDRQ